jgi:hypothetical protein
MHAMACLLANTGFAWRIYTNDPYPTDSIPTAIRTVETKGSVNSMHILHKLIQVIFVLTGGCDCTYDAKSDV